MLQNNGNYWNKWQHLYKIDLLYLSSVFLVNFEQNSPSFTTGKVSKYGVLSGPYFPVFRPEINPYLDTFDAVLIFSTFNLFFWGILLVGANFVLLKLY